MTYRVTYYIEDAPTLTFHNQTKGEVEAIKEALSVGNGIIEGKNFIIPVAAINLVMYEDEYRINTAPVSSELFEMEPKI